uniref:PDZ domain-containing protein n=1 Tax=Pseudictyota dubia TaxID=2749911 RepID=A0A7R9VUE9_9STRA
MGAPRSFTLLLVVVTGILQMQVFGLLSKATNGRNFLHALGRDSRLESVGRGLARHDFSDMKEHDVILSKPLGIVLEESDEDEKGVIIAKIDPNGKAATTCKLERIDICKGDKILAVNGEDCTDFEFEDVMDRIVESPNEVTLSLGRPIGNVAVCWQNGVCVSCKPGEYYGNVAAEAMFQIEYSCRSGSCGTCEQAVSVDGGGVRYVRPCSTKVPKGPSLIVVLPTDRYG